MGPGFEQRKFAARAHVRGAEKQAKRNRRVVLYAELPPDMLNVNPKVHAARMHYFKTTIANHFMRNGAEHVGFCQARDNEGNNCNSTVKSSSRSLRKELP